MNKPFNNNKVYELLSLKNKTAVITGGTSGIGLAIADLFFKSDANIVIIGRDKQKGENALNKILSDYKGNNSQNKFKNRCIFFQCDVGIHAECKKTCEKILDVFPGVEILVLNASMEFTEEANKIEIKNWQKIMDVNISGSFYFFRYLADSMIKNSKGNVIFISSVVSRTGAGGGMHYSTSKAALIGMMARINYEFLSRGIRANMISPGIVDTPMLRKKYPDTEEINKMLSSQVPMGRIGTPYDIAKLALFLASDMSEYICGQDILIDGGRLYYRRPVSSQTAAGNKNFGNKV